ncbi:hypothetical protein B0T22DRAFT_22852 [Podospora appendiculata]|uniref:Uncharacterized protein n=1 Tax=Podospora appendiculata TaxID=314037 RepID=A0AAE0XG95_9PEZI|nr:hypothetical protein B0T22DRAFT_22852 [Podospora appendiculata]
MKLQGVTSGFFNWGVHVERGRLSVLVCSSLLQPSVVSTLTGRDKENGCGKTNRGIYSRFWWRDDVRLDARRGWPWKWDDPPGRSERLHDIILYSPEPARTFRHLRGVTAVSFSNRMLGGAGWWGQQGRHLPCCRPIWVSRSRVSTGLAGWLRLPSADRRPGSISLGIRCCFCFVTGGKELPLIPPTKSAKGKISKSICFHFLQSNQCTKHGRSPLSQPTRHGTATTSMLWNG